MRERYRIESSTRLKTTVIVVFCIVGQLAMSFVVVPDMRTRIALAEMSLFVVLPLLFFYLLGDYPRKSWIPAYFFMLVVWFFTLAFFHEGSHILGLYLIGSKPTTFQLIPKFWEGDFKTAWVASEPINDWRGPIPGLTPYIKDVALSIVGFFLLKKGMVRGDFWSGAVLTFFCLGSLFDIVNNYSQKLLGYVEGNDFYGTALGWGETWSNLIGISFSLCTLGLSSWVIIRSAKEDE